MPRRDRSRRSIAGRAGDARCWPATTGRRRAANARWRPFARPRRRTGVGYNFEIVPDYKPQTIEQKWQERWRATRDVRSDRGFRQAEVLLPRDVRVPVGARARRARPQLHDRRRRRAHEADARLQRAASVRLGRVRPAGRERRDQERHPPRDVDARQHRPHEGAAPAARASATPGIARSPPACPSTTTGTSGCS